MPADNLLDFAEGPRTTPSTPLADAKRDEHETLKAVLNALFTVLSVQVLKFSVAFSSFLLFGYCALYPDVIRLIGACLFSVLMGSILYLWDKRK